MCSYFQPNEAGLAWQDMYQLATQKNEVIATFDFGVGQTFVADAGRLFHGVYKFTIKRADGSVRKGDERFSLLSHQGDKNIDIWI